MISKTQEEVVLDHLKEHGTITSKQAFQKYGITRLSAKIYCLRQKGYNIKSPIVDVKSRYGNGKAHVAEYRLVE